MYKAEAVASPSTLLGQHVLADLARLATIPVLSVARFAAVGATAFLDPECSTLAAAYCLRWDVLERGNRRPLRIRG